MNIYWLLFTFIALMAGLEQFSKYRKTIHYLYILTIIVLFILGTIRWERGTDWTSFYRFFLFPHRDSHFELGYYAWNLIIRQLTANYTIFLGIQNLLYYSCFLAATRKINQIYKFSGREYNFVILLYTYSQNFAGIFATRTQVAYSLCFLGLLSLIEGKKLKFVLFIFAGSLFHKSSIFFLLVDFIYNHENTDWKFYAKCIIFIFASEFLANFFIRYSYVFGQLHTYAMYIDTESNFSLSSGLMQCFLWAAMSLFVGRYVNDRVFEGLTRILIVGSIIYIWASIFTHVAFRVAGLYLNVLLILLPRIIITFNRQSRGIVISIFILYCGISVLRLLNGAYGPLYLPYKSIFDSFIVESF